MEVFSVTWMLSSVIKFPLRINLIKREIKVLKIAHIRGYCSSLFVDSGVCSLNLVTGLISWGKMSDISAFRLFWCMLSSLWSLFFFLEDTVHICFLPCSVGKWNFQLNVPLQVMEHEAEFPAFQKLSAVKWYELWRGVCFGGVFCSLEMDTKLSKVQRSRELDLGFLICRSDYAQDK